MLRRTLQSTALRHAARRNYASKSKKRALSKDQLAGKSKPKIKTDVPPVTAAATPPPVEPTAPPTATATPPPPPPSSGSSSMLPLAAVGLVGVGGIAYYLDLIPGLSAKNAAKDTLEEAKDTLEEEAAEVKEAVKEKVEDFKEKVEDMKESVGGRVRSIHVPTTERPPAKVPPPAPHPASGNRVSMKPIPPASTEEAAKELQVITTDETSSTLAKAHREIRATLDESLLQDLDSKTAAELRVRVVQLATELQERTKWEAVRLKEFLAMKEKETAEKYMEMMQKQRLELESTMARSLREQEDDLSRKAQAALQEKEDSIQSVVTAAAQAQEEEHKADIESLKERLARELSTKYESDFINKLAQEKQSFVDALQEKVQTIDDLSQQLQDLESALEKSRNFESGSLQAHRLSASALALADKLETSKGAAKELAALKEAAQDNSVILSAVEAVPASIESGIPTLSELQTRFETVYKKSRQAALVPAGRAGLEGQLLGIAFSSLKYAPDPDDAVSPEGDDTEFLLARARRSVQLGELERAIETLEKLKGQAAFTAKDWTRAAKDRVAADKAAHVVKMECVLLNKSLTE